MKKILFIAFALAMPVCLIIPQASAAESYNRVSEKTVKLVPGQKIVFQGRVRDGDEVLYRFKAVAGQSVTVAIVGHDADFSVSLNHGLDVEPIAQDTKSWTGKMPAEFNGQCEIAVHSSYKLAAYSLDITVK